MTTQTKLLICPMCNRPHQMRLDAKVCCSNCRVKAWRYKRMRVIDDDQKVTCNDCKSEFSGKSMIYSNKFGGLVIKCPICHSENIK